MKLTWVIATAVCFAAPSWGSDVIEVLRDYSKQTPGAARAAVTLWNWTPEQKQQAESFSTVQIVDDNGRRALRLTVTDKMPWGQRDSYRAFSIGPDLLPPTADAVRLRYRVIEGSVTVSCGSPTIYFGHSDVHSEPATLTADGDGWQTVEFSLHDGLIRNFRRARFARESPVIYYTRWIQEALYLNVHQGSSGTVLIDRVELLSEGRGKPYPTFASNEVRTISPIADFADEKSLAAVFTASHEPADFSGPPRVARPVWAPAKLSHAAGEAQHRGLLHIEHHAAEEVNFTGIKVDGNAQANAIALDLRAANAIPSKELSLDFVIYVGPKTGTFDWSRFAPPSSWRDQPDVAFNYYLCEPGIQGASYAFYHVRRAVPNGQWTRLDIPLADLICVYGSGDRAQAMARQQPIEADSVVAFGMLPSWRQHKSATTIDIDGVDWVAVPGDAASLRSFPQVDVDTVKLVPWRDKSYGGTRQMTSR